MSIITTLVKSLQKAPKKIKRGLKGLLMTPQILLAGLRKLWGMLTAVGSKLLVLPLSTLSGKLLAVSQLLLVVSLLLGIGYAIGGYRGGYESERLVIEAIVVYPIVAFAICGCGFLVSYPLDRKGVIGQLIITSGIRQRNRVSTGLVSVLGGGLATVVLTFLLANGLVDPTADIRSLYLSTAGLRTPFQLELGVWPTVGTFTLCFFIGTTLLYLSLSKQTRLDTRSDLTIVEVRQHDDIQTLRLRNDCETVVDLTASKIEDSHGNYYSLDRSLTFRPGETLTLTLPTEFALKSTDVAVPAGLSALYDELRVTTIYARSGETFPLEWVHEVDIE